MIPSPADRPHRLTTEVAMLMKKFVTARPAKQPYTGGGEDGRR